MKTVIFSGVLLIVLIVIIVFASSYTTSKVAVLNDLIHQISDSVQDDEWEKAEKLYKEISTKWEKTQSRLAILFHHDELEDIGVSFAYLKSYIYSKEKNKALAELSALEFAISHLQKTDKMQIENIF